MAARGDPDCRQLAARSVAVVVGGLRVSILTVVKGVLSLAMLLWAATVASNLFERRITRVSENARGCSSAS